MTDRVTTMSNDVDAKTDTDIEAKAKQVRLLLYLWDLGGSDVKRGELTKRLKRKKETAADYQDSYETLENEGAIAVSRYKVSLVQPKGLQMLEAGLKSEAFEFESQIGAKTANALLKWIREQDVSAGTVSDGAVAAGKTGESAIEQSSAPKAIASYDQFKQVALDVYNQLNRDYNLDDLVPIYRIRRTIGDRVSRSQFNDWMLEMQANDILQLQGGSVEDSAPDKIEDSITTELDGLRCYARRLTS
ncbi:hypothetical protein MC7420_5439 [Coleofasciculus chthonoplastes PCC 7420]|uniref:Uncharacterized protein n=2 Tax=Coleofasciculus chthonoplastes TaxID=64178 RepID=B4VPI8_9CYAN|nr:hypothetical protein MC7420_5439 [Coleofasciculus chthonoplastes PCC 7420]